MGPSLEGSENNGERFKKLKEDLLFNETILVVVDRPLRFSYLSRLAASGALAEVRCGLLTD